LLRVDSAESEEASELDEVRDGTLGDALEDGDEDVLTGALPAEELNEGLITRRVGLLSSE